MELADSTMRLAITARTPRSGSTLAGAEPDDVGGDTYASLSATDGALRWASTSSFNTRPSLPLPVMSASTRSCSLTKRLTAGLAGTLWAKALGSAGARVDGSTSSRCGVDSRGLAVD